MSFFAYETWKIKEDCPVEVYERELEKWFRCVTEKKEELFHEWVSVKNYTLCNKDGDPTGVYAMLFEFESLEGYQAYQKREMPGSEMDSLRRCYDCESVKTVYMNPEKTDVWFDYTQEKLLQEKTNGVTLQRFLEYEIWKVAPDVVWDDYEKMIVTWFTYVAEKKKELFEEWVSARYYQQCDENGNPTGVYVMLFEYDSLEGHHAYKSRKLHSYALNDGKYAQYAANDPYQFFDLTSVNIDCMQPLHTDIWLDCGEQERGK